MPLPGGSTDKFGNRFEGRWTTACMVEVLNETASSIRLEPLDTKGVEFWLRRKDKLEFHQVKRQTSSSGSWTLSKLSNENVLQNFYEILRVNEKSICMFISTQDVYILTEMVDRARRAFSIEEFNQEFLNTDNYSQAFDNICQIWNDCPKKEAFQILQRIYFRNTDEDTLKNIIVINSIKPLIEGNPATIADVLAQFALEETNKELNAIDIWRHLEERGFRRCRWNKDALILSAVENCTDRSLPKHTEATISGKVIPRDEAHIILDKFKTLEGKQSILVSGDAGVGKSGVLLQVVEALRKQGKPILAFRVDRLNPTLLPDDVGKQLGLPASPAIVLKAISDGRECLLIIDQLDAISETSGRNPEFFDCIREIIEQALNYPEMQILLACRKFDLDNDYRLRSLIGEQGFADSVQIRHLSHETIKQFINKNLNIDIHKLNKRQLDLLAIPLHLSLLAEISLDSEIDVINFKTTKDLFDKFWERKQRLLDKRSSRWVEVVFFLSNYMSERQTLIAPASIMDKFGILPEAMASEHILIKEGDRYAFFHQEFFDYTFARNFCAQNRELVPFMKKDVQHLFRRTQVMQILSREREENFVHYIADLESMLNDHEIRFHLKQIVFALLADLGDPNIDEWRVVAQFLDNSADSRSKEVKYILYKSTPWINLLKSEGQLSKWLASAREENINLAIILLSKVQKDQPQAVVDLIKPYIDLSETWNRRLCQIFKTSKIDACESFFELVLHAMDKGILDEIDELDPLAGHFWYAQKDLIKDHPEWACEFLSHYLNRKYMICLIGGQPNPFDREKGCITDHVRDEEIADSIKECAKTSSEAFIHELLPFILRLIGFNAYRDDKIVNSPLFDRIWRNRYYYDRFGIYIDVCILSSIEVAMASLAKTKPANFRIIAEELEDLDFDTIHYILIRGYAANGEQFVDDAVNYLIKYPVCLETGYVEDEFKAATELLEAITPYCSNEQLDKIESNIVGNYPNIEDHEKAQFKLYNGIDSSRRSESVINRLKELEKKFGQSLEEPPRTFSVGRVISPISDEDADKMSDEDWLGAILVYNSENHSFRLDGTNPVGGALELSRVMEKQVNLNPSRFAALVQKFPDDSNVYYFNAILRGITNTDLNIKLVLDVCRRCHNLQDKPCGRWICDLIRKNAENDLPDEALDIVAWYATEDPDPEYERWRPEGPEKTVYYGGDIINSGLNSVRGRAAYAIASLVFYDKSRIIYMKSIIEKIIEDPSIEVRSWVTMVLISILKYDDVYAIKLFQDLCNTEDILLGTHHVENFLGYALQTHISLLESILKRMVDSKEIDVVKAGARRICIASFEIQEARPLMESCLVGTNDQRLGAAEVFCTNIIIYPDFCKDKLIRFFSDHNEQVRKMAAGCFRHLAGSDLGKFTDLIEAFIESPSFDTDIEDLIWSLNRTTAKLPDVTYSICRKFIDTTILANSRNYSVELDVSKLILRLYSQNKESLIGEKCLDLIDIMIEKDVYRIEKELLDYER